MSERSFALLGIDVGTTHCKAGLFAADGVPISIASRPTVTRRAAAGWAYFEPEELWETVVQVLQEAAEKAQGRPIGAVGIASMAETGLLVDRKSGAPRSAILPWFDTAASPQAETLRNANDPRQRFMRAGIRPTFKCSLAKILWLRQENAEITRKATWLSAADYIAYRLSGRMATDYSLACRTYAFDLERKDWDGDWLGELGLPPDLFPPARSSSTTMGAVAAGLPGLPGGTPVAVTGHDHVCAAFAAGVTQPGQVFNSMGTAESFLGVLEERPLGEKEYRSGFTYGIHAAPGCYYWMGGISASGGSVEWLRALLGDPPLSYAELEALLSQAPQEPTSILYFPYLAGSGSPHSDARVRAAFVGLSADHGRADLAKAVLEGTAYELEYIRRAAEAATGLPIERLRVAGGGTRNPFWTQVKADVSGCALDLLAMPESTLLGAALLAGIGAGLWGEPDQVFQPGNLPVARTEVETVRPDPERHPVYRQLYEQAYLKLQETLRSLPA